MNPNEPPQHCIGCGAEIRVRAPLGHCPRCLVTLGTGAACATGQSAGDRPVFKARRFGDYELLEQIGRGGMGVVYRALQISLNRTVALKMVLDAQINSPLALRRFEIEAEAAARLEHPHIVSIFEIGSEEEQPFISMGFIEGESLAEKIAKGEFGVPPVQRTKTGCVQVQVRLAQLMSTVARAVHYAHQHGVVHRDIKPGNILLDAEDQPYLTDFGLAKLTDADQRLSQTGALMGTPTYMAPEQVAGADASVAADVYSLGAVLYELLTGRVPFVAETPVKLLRQVAEQPPQKPSTVNLAIDRDLETICLKCLEKSPSNRYGSARAFAEDLERWQRREPILARPAGPILRLRRWIRRYPVGAALIASLFVGLVVSLAFLRSVLAHQREAEKANRAAEQARSKFENTRAAIFRAIGVSNFWEKPDSSIPIPSEVLAQAIDTDPGILAPGSERYRIGMLLEEDPAGVIIGYAHLIHELERTLSESLGRTVLFDLTLYHDKHQAGINGLVKQEVDILKIGGASFLMANKEDAGIRPLIGQNPPKKVVVFARKGSGISTVGDLMNKSVLIKDRSSTVSMWGAFHLVKAGIPIGNLEVVARSEVRLNNSRMVIPRSRPIIESVLLSDKHAGIESESVYMEHERSAKDLVILGERFPSSRVYWIASSTLPPEVASAFTKAMVALTDPEKAFGLPDRVKGYSEVTKEEVDELREAESIMEGIAPSGK